MARLRNNYDLPKLKKIMRKTLTKKQKLELELMAIKLWFQAFGKPSMSSDNDKVYMSRKLNEYTDKLIKLNTK